MLTTPLIYAIDFGTSNSLLAAASREERFAPIPLDPKANDPSILRSILYFPSPTKVFYGSEAIAQFVEQQGQGRLIRSIKKHLPIRSFIGTFIDDRPANLEDLIGFFLGEMRRRANAHFQQEVDRVVLGRPAKFSPDDGDDKFAEFRLRQAAERAGFKHIEFCAEPVAAAYQFRSQLTEPKTVLVGDFGGGTSDFTVVRLGRDHAEVLSMGGVSVAGDALDGAVMRERLTPYFGRDLTYTVPFGTNVLHMPMHLMEKICSPADVSLLGKRDIREFLRNLHRWQVSDADRRKLDRLLILIEEQLGFPLFESIEACKRELSAEEKSRIVFDHPVIELRQTVHRKEFESDVHPFLEKILHSLDETVRQAQVKPEDIDIVCCTGGTAKVPALNRELVARFGAEKIQAYRHFHSVVEGLSHRAQELLR